MIKSREFYEETEVEFCSFIPEDLHQYRWAVKGENGTIAYCASNEDAELISNLLSGRAERLPTLEEPIDEVEALSWNDEVRQLGKDWR
jgi:hypothetical protein